MKAKHFVFLVIFFAILMTTLRLAIAFIITLNIDSFTYGLIAGSVRILFYLSLIGLIIKIYRYHNKKDFLNS